MSACVVPIATPGPSVINPDLVREVHPLNGPPSLLLVNPRTGQGLTLNHKLTEEAELPGIRRQLLSFLADFHYCGTEQDLPVQ